MSDYHKTLVEIREMIAKRLADDRPRFSVLFALAVLQKIDTALEDES